MDSQGQDKGKGKKKSRECFL
jgi:hypothetical protein